MIARSSLAGRSAFLLSGFFLLSLAPTASAQRYGYGTPPLKERSEHFREAAPDVIEAAKAPAVRAIPAPEAGEFTGLLPLPAEDADYRHGKHTEVTKVELGRLLFFDKILSGNLNISCATCHHPLAATGDDLSLSVGEGASGLGIDRDLGAGARAVPERVPRNAPPLFNLGAHEFTRLFHDGRVEVDGGVLHSPADIPLPAGLDNVLAAQAMLPVTSGTEMAGQRGENPVADAAAAKRFNGQRGVWELLARRLRTMPEYVDRFREAFPHQIQNRNEISFVHAANAIGAYQAVAFRSDQSPFDRRLRGDHQAMGIAQTRGMALFYGRAGCARCHSGKFQTDHDFHAIAMPPLGPGKGDGFDEHDDFGRERVTGKKSDRYRFRTPSLRNVAITGPWGHNGAYSSLREMIRHHADPIAGLNRYHPSRAVLPSRPDLDKVDIKVLRDRSSMQQLALANELAPVSLSERDVDDLLAFLTSLTDPRMRQLEGEIPRAVPSGLPVSDNVKSPAPGLKKWEPGTPQKNLTHSSARRPAVRQPARVRNHCPPPNSHLHQFHHGPGHHGGDVILDLIVPLIDMAIRHRR